MSDFLDFNDVEVKSKNKERYKGISGEKHRIGIIWPKVKEGEKQSGPFGMKKTHYHEKYFLCKEGVCCDKLGPADNRFVCLVVKYKTNKDGTIKKREGEVIPFDFEVLEWVFKDTKFTLLKGLHNEWDLKTRDFLVELKGKSQEQFQDLILTPCKESIWQMKPEFMELIYKESEPMRVNMERALGQDLSTDEIKELLGLELTQPQDVVSSSENLDDILAEV